MRGKFGLMMLTAILFLRAAPARGQDIKEILQILPGDSLAFVVTNRLEVIDERLQAMTKKFGVALPISPLELAKASLGIGKGLDAKGRIAVAILPAAEEGTPPIAILYVPVTDYGEFVGQFQGKDEGISEITMSDGRKMAAAKKGKFALLTPSEYSGSLKGVLSSQENLASWAAPLESWLAENGVSAVATPRGIKQALGKARKELEKAKAGLGDKQEAVGPWIGGLSDFLRSIETGVTHAGVGGRIDKGGNIVVDGRSLFAKDSSLARAVGDVKPLAGGALAGLPAGPYALAFGGATSPKLMELAQKMNVEFIKLSAKEKAADINPEKLKQLGQNLSKMSKGVEGMSFLIRTGKGKDAETIFARMVGIIKTTDAAAYLDTYEKAIPEMDTLYRELKVPSMPEITVKKKMVGNLKVLEVTTDLQANKGEQPDPVQAKVLELMFGAGGKIKTSVAAIDASDILMTYTSAEGLKEILQEVAGNKKGLQDDADVGRTMALLPKGSQWVVLLNPTGLAELTQEALKNFAPNVRVGIPEVPPTSPIGIGVRLSNTGLDGQLVVPAQLLEALGRLVGQGKGA